MKIAIISDIHGNFPALFNVINDAVSNNVDKYLFVGDYIFDLPFSNEVTQMIMNLENAYVIKGNKESYLCSLVKENQQEWIYDQMGAVYQTYRSLNNEALNYLINLEEVCFIPLDLGGVVYATHYLKDLRQQTKSECSSAGFHKKMLEEPFTHEQFLSEFDETLKNEDLRSAINSINASVIVFGHNHLQCYGYCDGKLIINPGSCGQPLDFDNRASYTILETTASRYRVIERRVQYDIEALIIESKKSSLYKEGKIWSELVFLAQSTGRDYFGIFFKIANQIAESKGEKGKFFSNETWKETYKNFLDRV